MKLKKNKNGKYRRQLKGKDGKIHSLYAPTLKLLEARVAAWRTEQDGLDPTTVTVADYAHQQLNLLIKDISPQTYANYKSKIDNYIASPPLGEMMISDVRLDDIKRAMMPVQDYTESTYDEVYSLVRRIFSAARRNKLIIDDPTDGLSAKGGKPNKHRPALSDEQASTLLTAVEGLQVETFCRIGLHAGLRREETLGLYWPNVHLEDDEQPYIEVKTAWHIHHNRGVVTEELKSKAAERKIPIPANLADYLRRVRPKDATGLIYANADGSPYSETQWRRMWEQVTKRTTAPRTYVRWVDGKKVVHTVVPKLGEHARNNPGCVYSMDFSPTSHQLRHTYITNLCHVTDDIKTIQYLAGHEKAQTTMDIYAEVKHTDPARNAGVVEKAFGKACTDGKKSSD